MLTDYHSHLLPGIDDGAKNVTESLNIINKLREQGIERIVATPHFYSHNESFQSFLERRQIAFDTLQRNNPPIPVIMGAEIYLNKGLSSQEGLEKLSVGADQYLLLELPWSPFRPWIMEEICNIQYQFNVIPMIAHLNRYLGSYSPKEIEQICSISGAVIQINNEAFLERKSIKFVQDLVKNGYPVVFGSDTHNMLTRAPDFDVAFLTLKSKFKKEYDSLMALNESLI
ncbi:MAG: CpsB/CapC family capsule biosynthesis tyrosine phosphatase [Oscillospiraceae bacterium]